MYRKFREKLGLAGTSPNRSHSTSLERKNTGSEVQFGPLQLKQKTMSVLLVFSREDAQSDGFWWAAERGGYKCNLAKSHDGALECFLDKQQEVVIIDHRHNKSFDAEALCRYTQEETRILNQDYQKLDF
ncbi:hypothetical protein CHS0354_021492 [Potamilus streckersoni]|uniref:PDE8-like REC N-terminal domain-containing protein n=1 Tax=Potamilus streckersoni TaxID=2493646 RepID=A0AAE0SB32_9BIVA|nr:hypothetical protein CHS0354_021492 [Potamilus streckersoni]